MFSEPVFISLLSGFLGVIVGGFITYLTTRQIEVMKWNRQKQGKLLEDRRKALELLSTWIEPLDRISNRVGMLSFAFMLNPKKRNIDIVDFGQELEKYKLAPPSRFLLPDSLNQAVDEIENLIFQLELSTWSLSGNEGKQQKRSGRAKEKRTPETHKAADEFNTVGGRLQHEVRQFKELLKDEFRTTYQ